MEEILTSLVSDLIRNITLYPLIEHPNEVYFCFQEAEASKEGNAWIVPLLKGLKRSSPTSLKITLHSVMFLPNVNQDSCNNTHLSIVDNLI